MKDVKLSTTELHAYVDNELDEKQRHQIELAVKADPKLQADIDAIRALKSDIASAFSQIPQSSTPAEMLELPEQASVSEVPVKKTAWKAPYWAAAACLVMGLTGGYLLGQSEKNSSPSQDWIAQVVNYQDMYSADTLAHVVTTQEDQELTLQRLSSALKQDIIIPEFSEQSIEFKRGQILTSQQQPVIQLAFLDTGSGTPIALCITPNSDAPKDFADGNMYGVNYVNWSNDKLDFLIVGDISHKELNALARDAKLQLSNSSPI